MRQVPDQAELAEADPRDAAHAGQRHGGDAAPQLHLPAVLVRRACHRTWGRISPLVARIGDRFSGSPFPAPVRQALACTAGSR